MTQVDKQSTAPKEVKLPDGTTAFVFDKEQIEVLSQIIDNEIWKIGLWKRAKRVSLWAGGLVVALLTLSDWLPWITRMITFLTEGMPK